MSEPAAGNHHEEEVLGKAYDARLMRRLIAYVRPYGDMALGSLGLILLSSLLQLLGPLVTAIALDLFMRPPGSPAGQVAAPSALVRNLLLARGISPADVAVPGLTVVAVFYLSVLALTFCALYAQGYVLQLMGQYIMKDMRGQIFGHLQRLPLSFYDKNPLGRLVTRV
ncbi:MAG TPA: ABC transporter transmembrane domain-containing protein, partial [Thermoanaerobaculia bacterium]|nr:ABC transporter transmembrane domain-containing protein [Thermoanaerobaculia bacterium]